MKSAFYILTLVSSSIIFFSCNNKPLEQQETSVKGNITIGVDNSLQPVLSQHLKIWDSSYPEGKITPIYSVEKDIFNKLFSDSVRLIVATRDITDIEKKAGAAKKVHYTSLAIARDAVVIITHPSAQDSVMSLGMLRNILQDSFPRKYNVVFDDPNSSLVRYVQDQIMMGAEFPKNVYAAGSNEKVIEYVSKNKDAIGIVGLSQVFNHQSINPAGEFITDVQVVALLNDSLSKAYKPYQALIALKYYPLTRDIYFITGETWQGLGTGFANFLSQPQGQLIFKKEYFVPLRTQLEIREATLK